MRLTKQYKSVRLCGHVYGRNSKGSLVSSLSFLTPLPIKVQAWRSVDTLEKMIHIDSLIKQHGD